MFRGKKYKKIAEKVEHLKRYKLIEAVGMLEELSYTKFDPTVDIAVRLGVNPAKSDQNIRSAVVLPHGTGKKVRVLVFAKGEKATEASGAGADIVGAEEVVEKIKEGWMEFDKVIATPDMMKVISRVSRILGPRGLMPNPKVGTVTQDIAKAVKEQKAGKVSFRVDKAGNVHAGVGKLSFGKEKLEENIKEMLLTLWRLKPATSKGVYFKNISISTTMGAGVKIDTADVMTQIKK